MAIICLKVPSYVSTFFENLDVPGTSLTSQGMHVTILHFKNFSIDDVASLLAPTAEVASQTLPFVCGFKEVSSFPVGEDGVPIICPMISPGLHSIRTELAAACDARGIEYSKKWPDYNPHMTLAYSDTPFAISLGFPVTWTVMDLAIWDGENECKGVSVHIPLQLNQPIKPDITL